MWERGDGNKTNMINNCPQRSIREVSLVFVSHFQKTPGGSEFLHLEKLQSNLIFQSAELLSRGNHTSLPHLYLGTQKITRYFQKWIPLFLLDPNDPTSQFGLVLLLGTVSDVPQPELGD